VTTTAPFLSRHLGDYLLVAQLSEDPLGTVFRALYAADERRFVRLRILQSEELRSDAIHRAIRENRLRDAALSHDAIVQRPELDVVEGIPYMTWDETAGWTLDTMLARVRAFGIRIPVEYGLLIGERIAAALEHAHQTKVGDRPANHGLLWPGFVTITHDAAVRVGGFGIAEAILPALGGPRMTADIAPYVAPESRGSATVSDNADVYSLGAILVELITGRRPSLDTPSAELRAGDPRSDEVGAFLRRCLAASDERFPTAVDAHRALQQMVTGNPFSLFTTNLALFLYKLLNPESQSVAPSSDWESTNPVLVETKTRRRESTAAGPPSPDMPRRRQGDLDPTEAAAAREAIAPLPPVAAPIPPPADFSPAPVALQEHAAGLIESGQQPMSRRLPSGTWRGPAAALTAAAGLVAGVMLVTNGIQAARATSVPAPATALAPSAEVVREAVPSLPVPLLESAAPPAGTLVPAAGHSPAAARPGKRIRPELRQPTEDMRLRAALARIEADRNGAREKAADVFDEGRESEKEGERLLQHQDYDAAQMAFSRAAQLFQQAQESSWEQRVQSATLSANP